MSVDQCPLCHPEGETVLWRNSKLRIIAVEDANYPGYCRVVWNAHVREMSDIDLVDRAYLMEAVYTVESALRMTMAPDKVNLASLGNLVPHVHWHVIARWDGDAHFPGPIWAPAPPRDAAMLAAESARTQERRTLIVKLPEMIARLMNAKDHGQAPLSPH